jgi:hypothetical protein
MAALRTWGTGLAVVVALALPSAAGDDQDDPVLAQLEAARTVAAAAGDAIWPGFDLRKIPIAVYQSGGEALAIQVPAAPEGFVRLETERLTTPVFRGAATEAMNANTSGRLGDEIAAFIQRGSLSAGVLPGDIDLLFHECGHAFQARAPQGGPQRWPIENAAQVADYPSSDAANNAWGRIEGRLLRAALEAEDDETARERALDFLAVRSRRRAGLSGAIATYEQHLELNEGLAEYFGTRAVLLAPPSLGAGFGTGGDFHSDLLERLARINVAGRGAERARFYLTGVAQGLLLDRLGPASWKHEVEARGAPLEELLAAALGFDAQDAQGLAARSDRAAATGRFEALLASEQLAAEAALAARRSRLLAILAGTGRALVLDLSHAGGAGNTTSFDPMNIVAVEPDVKVHCRMLELEFAGGAAKFGLPVVQDLRRQWLIARLPEGAIVERDHGVRAEGLELRWDDAAVLEEEGLVVAVPRAPAAAVDAAPVRALLASAADESRRPVPAPPFEVTDLAGAVHSQPEAVPRETTLVFVSAASWAVPAQRFSRRTLAALGDRPRESAKRRWLLVATQCSTDELAALLGSDAPRGHVVHDADRWLARLFDVESYPAVVRIGADGRIAGRWSGDNAETEAAAVEGF